MACVSETSLTTPDLTKCLICQELIQEDSLLSCRHTICVHCLNNNNSNNNCSNNKPDEGLECPLCSRIFLIPSDGIKNLTNNFFMNQLHEGNKPTGPESLKKITFCELCSGSETEIPSTSYCIECKQHICERCDEIHTRINSTKSHQVIRSDDVLSAEEKLKYCEQHPSEMKRLYCYDCKTIMCHKCTHKPNKHSLAQAKESMAKFREELKKNFDKVCECTSREQEEIIQLDTDRKSFMESVDSVRRDILQKYEQLMSLIESQQNQLIKELNSFKDKVLKEIEIRKNKMEIKFSIRESFKKYCVAMMSKGIACDIFCVTRDLHARAEKLLKTKYEPGCYKLSGIEITFKPSLVSADTVDNFIGQLTFPSQETADIARHRDTPSCDQNVGLTNFLDNPKLLYCKKDANTPVTGVTVLGSDFFVVRQSPQVYVYNCDSFALIRDFKIKGSRQLRGIVSCTHYNCLYITNPIPGNIFRHDLTTNATSTWATRLSCDALWVNHINHNVLATMSNIKRIQEYTTEGCLVREINPESSIERPVHCIQLSTGNYVVSHSGSQHHRVCIVNQSGRIIKSYGNKPGHGWKRLMCPCQLAVDVHDNILVADFVSNRLELLSPTLTYLGGVQIPGHHLYHPYTLYFDQRNDRLYVGECGGGHVFILGANYHQQ